MAVVEDSVAAAAVVVGAVDLAAVVAVVDSAEVGAAAGEAVALAVDVVEGAELHVDAEVVVPRVEAACAAENQSLLNRIVSKVINIYF